MNVLHHIVEGGSLSDTLEMICLGAEEAVGSGMRCSILLADDANKRISLGAAPNLPELYKKAIDGRSIGVDAGPCGAAVLKGERVIVENVQTDQEWFQFREIAEEIGICACWSQPFHAKSGNLLGTFGMYFDKPYAPSKAEIELIENQAQLASLAVMRSTSEREMAEAKRGLEYQKEALEKHAIISVTDVSGNIKYVNEKFCELCGYAEDELVGQNHRILKSGEQSPEFYEGMWRTIANGVIWNGEIKNRKKNGDSFWVNLTILPFLNARGVPYQYVCTVTDITMNKQLEEKLKRERQTLGFMVENLGQGLSVFDKDLNLVVVNNKFAEFLKLPENLARVGTRFEDIIRHNAENGEYGEGDIEEMVRERVELARTPQPHQIEKQYRVVRRC